MGSVPASSLVLVQLLAEQVEMQRLARMPMLLCPPLPLLCSCQAVQRFQQAGKEEVAKR